MEPLASRLRPDTLDGFVGQEHLVGAGKPIRAAMEELHLFSFILWGPPGVGKTTLARIYADAIDAKFYELSAVSAGKSDVKAILDESYDGHKILFLDEIHRFNKAQQDYLLPFVESGKLTLIGATTENPSFEVIPALLSRCRVFVLKELSEEDMRRIIARAPVVIDDSARDWLIALASGDARQALTVMIRREKNITIPSPHSSSRCSLRSPMRRCIILRVWSRRVRTRSSSRAAWGYSRAKISDSHGLPRSLLRTPSFVHAKRSGIRSAPSISLRGLHTLRTVRRTAVRTMHFGPHSPTCARTAI